MNEEERGRIYQRFIEQCCVIFYREIEHPSREIRCGKCIFANDSFLVA